MPNPSPTLRRRSLSGELERLRRTRGLTAEQVDIECGWTKGKTARMERNEWVRPDPRDIRDMLDVYGVADSRRREELLLWARQGRERGWWHPYRNMLSNTHTTYIGLEYGTAVLRVFELAVVPGIVQTEDYARAIMLRRPGRLSEEEIEHRVKIRMERQQILYGEDPTLLRIVLDEASLRRGAGSTLVMKRQLEHLVKVAELPKVELQVIPFSKGTHAGTQGPFTILKFDEGADALPAVYTENVAGEHFIEQPDEVESFESTFESLVAMALDMTDSIELVSQIAESLA